MNEFVKPKTEYVIDKDYIESLINVQLKKDLYGDEEICSVCKGTGLIIRENPYGLKNDPDKTKSFPYIHQSLTFCPNCFNGVVHRCQLCGGIIQRGYTKHNCEQQRALDRKEFELRRAKQLEEAELVPPEIFETMECFFSDDYGTNDGFFRDWEEFFEYWECEHNPDDPKPEYVWSTKEVNMSMNADDIIENATEELYEDAYYDVSGEKSKELQVFLDKWCSECGIGKTYYGGEYKVKIPWEDYDG